MPIHFSIGFVVEVIRPWRGYQHVCAVLVDEVQVAAKFVTVTELTVIWPSQDCTCQ